MTQDQTQHKSTSQTPKPCKDANEAKFHAQPTTYYKHGNQFPGDQPGYSWWALMGNRLGTKQALPKETTRKWEAMRLGYILGNFAESKPFWEDSFHLLECFTCEFLQEVSKSCKEPIKQMDWMMQWIKKGKKIHIVAICPRCTFGDPWTMHNSQMGYTLLQIDPPMNKQEILSQQKKHKPAPRAISCHFDIVWLWLRLNTRCINPG
jgi:hypothetical protein